MKTFKIWERQINEVKKEIASIEERISQLDRKPELTSYEQGGLRNARFALARHREKLHEMRLRCEEDYNLEAFGRCCPVPIEDLYYEKRLRMDGVILCIKL